MSSQFALIVGLAAIGGAITLVVATLGADVRDRQQVGRNLASVQRTGTLARRVAGPSLADSLAQRVLRPLGGAAVSLSRRMSGADITETIRQRLDLAGNPSRWTVERVLLSKTLGLFGCGAFGLLIGHAKASHAVLYGIVFAVGGFFLPDMLLKNVGLKRQELIQRTLPDSLDMLTISVEAGLAFDAALSQVARNTEGPVGAEFSRVLQEMRIGKSRGDAFRSLQGRTTVPEFRSFVSAIVQADSFGIPIANVLRTQAKEMRLKRRQRAEEQAQKVPLKIMIPVVMCIFPALFVVIIGPGVIGALQVLHHH